MADLAAALARVLEHEGGYADDPDDRGGETYRGIARRFHPDWSGWSRVDALKRGAGFPRSLAGDRRVEEAVAALYRDLYWDRFHGDSLPDQPLAEELFDTAVNLGVRRAVRFLQDSLNLLNRSQRNYADLVVDGWFGDATLDAVRAVVAVDGDARFVVRLINAMQAAHYIDVMRHDSTQEKYARGWLTRA
jgi:lysozyme family protein